MTTGLTVFQCILTKKNVKMGMERMGVVYLWKIRKSVDVCEVTKGVDERIDEVVLQWLHHTERTVMAGLLEGYMWVYGGRFMVEA